VYKRQLIAYALALLAGSAMACRWSGDLGGADPAARGFPRGVKLLLFVAAGTLMTHIVYGAEEIVGALRGVGR